MQGGYTVAPLSPETSDAAFLLVGALAPGLGIARWRRYCDGPDAGAGASEPRLEVRVAINPRGHVQGLCLWSQARHAVHGRILDVPIFIVASAADESGVAAALVEDLCTIAGRLDCAALRIRSEASPRLLAQFQVPKRRDGRSIALILDPHPLLDAPWGPSQDDSLPVKT
ncbi:hypothetical protein IP69_04790 [Bosea sp. AAP35]|nr:hypothetical protein IP69_04790 [Bosea sp. AAP35]